MRHPRIALLVTLGAVLFTQPFLSRGSFERESDEKEAQEAQGALEWRAMTLRGPDGLIPKDGLARARAQMRRMTVESVAEQSARVFGANAQLSRSGWRWLGPSNIGGRVRAIAIHPVNTDTLFAGSVSGGIWRTDDAGGSWRPVDDFMGNLAVAAIVINPRNPSEMYAGTGENVYSNYDALHGGGIFKSTDGGVTWSLLPATAPSVDDRFFQGVARLAISSDGSVLLAAAGGYIFRTTNGGATFSKSSQAGLIDVNIDPTNASKAVAVGFSGIGYYSRDGGVTWQASSGAPTASFPGRLEVTYAPTQPDLVYLATADGSVYASTNGGISYSPRFTGLRFAQGWYNLTLWVNPRDANHLLLGAEQLYESLDGGSSWRQISTQSIHVDHHVIVEHPRFDNAANRTLYFGNDGGVYRADANPGGTYSWQRRLGNLGITQFYGAAGNPANGQIIGGTQDNGTALYRPEAGTIWSPVLSGDGGFCAWDQTDPRFTYLEMQYLRIFRTTGGGSPLDITSGITDSGSANSNFIAPFILDPNDQGRLLAGGRSLWRSEDVRNASSFPTWTNIKSGAAESPITAIAVASGASDVIWVGHTGGNVYKTTNGTSASPSWTKMYSSLGGPFITRVTIDPTNFNVVYVSIGGFGKPNIVRTDDGGVTWVDATGSGANALPTAPVRDVDVDPFDPATIYAGSEVGLFVSHDRGATWALPQEGPANVSVDELFVMGSTLVAATHGRGLFAQDLNPQGTPTMSIAPDHIDFGAQPTNNQTASQHVTVTNTGTGPLTIQSVQVSAGDTDSFFVRSSGCFNATLSPAGTCGFDASFIPRREGPLSALVDVSSTAPGSPHHMTLSGVGEAVSTALPAPWTQQDIGAVGVAGSATYTNGTFSVRGSGADIWGTADAFHYVYQPLPGDGTIVARVATVQNVNVWTKAGVMIRATTDAASPQASVFVTPGKGIALQWRSAAGGVSTSQTVVGAAPKWVKLVRTANSVAASYSADGTTWTALATVNVTLPQSALAGLPITSHDNSQLATTAIDNVAVSAASSGLPSPWTDRDIGAVGVAGSATFANGLFTIKGSGADIWGTADAFHYVYQPLPGDGTIVARVATVQNVNVWTKAGVMIRATTDAASPQASVFVTPGKGIALQWRSAAGGVSTSQTVAGAAPKWVKLVRTANSVAASYSADGTTWTALATVNVTLPQSALAGLPITSHDNTHVATATIDRVQLTIRD